jgi:hypothetical protein
MYTGWLRAIKKITITYIRMYTVSKVFFLWNPWSKCNFKKYNVIFPLPRQFSKILILIFCLEQAPNSLQALYYVKLLRRIAVVDLPKLGFNWSEAIQKRLQNILKIWQNHYNLKKVNKK